MLITGVSRAGLAASAGVEPGLLIVEVEHKPVTTLKELREVFRTASVERGVALKLEDSTGRTRDVKVRAAR